MRRPLVGHLSLEATVGTKDLKHRDQHGAGEDHTGLATPVPATRQGSRRPEDMST